MITGVETAGLVLAVFPLVVEGLKTWKEGADSFKTWRKTRQTLRQYVMKAENQRVIFENTIEELLSDVVQSHQYLSEMLQDPGGSLWRDAKYEERIKAHLDRSYGQFVATVDEMKKLLTEISEKLGTNRSENSYDELSRLERGVCGWKLMIGRESLMDHLKKIEDANKFLQQTVTQSFKLEPTRRNRRSQKIGDAIKSVRNQATSLYNALFQDECWTCTCKESHVASLRLEARSNELALVDPLFRLRIVLSAGDSESKDWIGTIWRDLEVKCHNTGKMQSQTNDERRSPGSNTRKTKAPDLPGRREVRFAIDQPPPSIANLSLEVHTARLTDGQRISDLCATLSQNCKSKEEVGFIEDSRNSVNAYYRYHLCVSNNDNVAQIRNQSLASMLKSSWIQSPRAGLSRVDRLQIAVNLASSVLQLEATPWLKHGWRSSDIGFYDFGTISQTVRGSSSMAIDLYLSWRLGQAKEEALNSANEQNDLFVSYGIRNTRLLSLAFVLIELSLNRTLEDMAIAEDHDANEIVSRRKTALRIYQNVYQESGTRYGDVVQMCLFCLFQTSNVSFENEIFQQAFSDEIVTPLANDLKVFRGDEIAI